MTRKTYRSEGKMSIGQTREGQVFVQFPEPLQCIGFTPEMARNFAAKLIEQAEMIERGVHATKQ